MIAENSYPIERIGDQWVLCLDDAHDTLLNDAQTRVSNARSVRTSGGRSASRSFPAIPAAETPAVRNQREKREQHEAGRSDLREDETVRSLVSEFGAELKLESVRPIKQ